MDLKISRDGGKTYVGGHHLRGGVDLKIGRYAELMVAQSHHLRGGVDLKDKASRVKHKAGVTTFVVVWI